MIYVEKGKVYLGTAAPSSGGGGQTINNQDITITANGEYTADEGYTGIGTATVNVPNPSTGTLSISSNGTYNVTQYASADVNCPDGDIVSATNTTGTAIASGDKVWLQKVTGGYSAVTLPQSSQFENVGSVTVNASTGVASNFSTSNYLKLASSYKDTVDLSKPWTFRTHIKLGSIDTGRNNSFLHTGNGSTQVLSERAPFMLYFSMNSPYDFYFRPNNAPQIYGSVNYVVGEERWIECGWTGTEYFCRYSTDGINYVDLNTPEASTNACTNTSDWVSLGFFQAAVYAYFRGDIYLNDTSMENDGAIVWRPYMNVLADKSGIFSGIAEEAIAASGTGNVKTALGGGAA